VPQPLQPLQPSQHLILPPRAAFPSTTGPSNAIRHKQTRSETATESPDIQQSNRDTQSDESGPGYTSMDDALPTVPKTVVDALLSYCTPRTLYVVGTALIVFIFGFFALLGAISSLSSPRRLTISALAVLTGTSITSAVLCVYLARKHRFKPESIAQWLYFSTLATSAGVTGAMLATKYTLTEALLASLVAGAAAIPLFTSDILPRV